MGTMGRQWRAQVARDEKNYHTLRSGITERELLAAAWVAQAQLHDLEAGIASCVSRNSDSLALPVPTPLVATDTLRNFMTGLGSQSIMADIAIDADGPGTSLLLLTPQD